MWLRNASLISISKGIRKANVTIKMWQVKYQCKYRYINVALKGVFLNIVWLVLRLFTHIYNLRRLICIQLCLLLYHIFSVELCSIYSGVQFIILQLSYLSLLCGWTPIKTSFLLWKSTINIDLLFVTPQFIISLYIYIYMYIFRLDPVNHFENCFLPDIAI